MREFDDILIDAQRGKIKRLEEENKALRNEREDLWTLTEVLAHALKDVEYVSNLDDDGNVWDSCPICGDMPQDGHNSDCVVWRALELYEKSLDDDVNKSIEAVRQEGDSNV